jgi:hypothetical protein
LVLYERESNEKNINITHANTKIASLVRDNKYLNSVIEDFKKQDNNRKMYNEDITNK